jgi:hypothetical protein
MENIQRAFVWNEEQIERLFDSIMREYPIGALLVWRTKSRIKRRKFIDNFKHTLKLTDFNETENEQTKLLVLDGQQRLQSLFIGLKGSYEKKELHFDILSGEAAAPEDIRYRFNFVESVKAGFPWIKFKGIVFDNQQYDKIAESVISAQNGHLLDDQKSLIRSNIARIVRQFCADENVVYQELDSVDNPEI